jgi:ribulose kinase
VLPEEADGVLLGTACVAATASGIHAGLREACKAMVRLGREIAPDQRVIDFFDRRYDSFLLLHRHRRAVDDVAAAAPRPGSHNPSEVVKHVA